MTFGDGFCWWGLWECVRVVLLVGVWYDCSYTMLKQFLVRDGVCYGWC